MHPFAAHARASASAAGGGAGSPRKHDRRPPPGNDRSEPGALRPLGPRDLDPPASPAGAKRPLAAAFGNPGPLAFRLSAGSQTCGRPRARAPRLDTRPPRLAVPAPPPSCRAPRQGPAPPSPPRVIHRRPPASREGVPSRRLRGCAPPPAPGEPESHPSPQPRATPAVWSPPGSTPSPPSPTSRRPPLGQTAPEQSLPPRVALLVQTGASPASARCRAPPPA